MIKVNYPTSKLKIILRDGVEKIFDPIRKRWLLLTPEEWVRQNIMQYILETKKYPASLMAIEKEVMLGELKKRCDIVLYDRNSLPWMIIECKEMKSLLDHNVVDQILRYHISLPAEFLIITSGSYTYGFKKDKHLFKEIDEFPDYPYF